MTDQETQQKLAADLVRIADAMETAEPGSAFAKELSRDYKATMNAMDIFKGVREGEYKGDKKKFALKKKECFDKILKALDDFENWKTTLKTPWQSSEIVFAYPVNYQGFPHEIQLCQCDSFYMAYSGYATIKCRVSLFSVAQLKGYPTLEKGLLSFALDMVKGHKRKEFIKKYVIPYNKKVKAIQNEEKD